MRFDIITIFPKVFSSYLSETILHRAIKKKLINIQIHDLRKYSAKGDPHKSVDDRPYGGGPGMILKVEPICRALCALCKSQIANRKSRLAIRHSRIIMLTPSGKRYTQRDAERLSKYKRVILLCGRYEGFDARVDKLCDEKISIGDYVLAGGELAAMVIVETTARQIPGVVGNKDALKEETFSRGLQYQEYPQYTRPEVFYPIKTEKQRNRETKEQRNRETEKPQGWRVPKVLLSGDHKKIYEWRVKKSIKL